MGSGKDELNIEILYLIINIILIECFTHTLYIFSFPQSQPDENESQTDVSFRHITEITILTVQLIVEFAKGLPAFTKIPQEDQITLLKVSYSMRY